MSKQHITELLIALMENNEINAKKALSQALTEISKKTLGSYVKKASQDAADHEGVSRSFRRDTIVAKDKDKVKAFADTAYDSHDKSQKRIKGIEKAVKKLTKEANETFGDEPGDREDFEQGVMDRGENDDGPVKYTAPSYWSTYFINGDTSGFDGSHDGEQELKAADAFIEWVGLGKPFDAEEVGFLNHHDAWEFCPYAGDCSEYSFHT